MVHEGHEGGDGWRGWLLHPGAWFDTVLRGLQTGSPRTGSGSGGLGAFAPLRKLGCQGWLGRGLVVGWCWVPAGDAGMVHRRRKSGWGKPGMGGA